MLRLNIFLALSLLLPGSAFAESSSNEILNVLDHGNDQEKFFANGFIQGNMVALSWANTYLTSEGERLIFCRPASLNLTFDQEIRILKDRIEESPTLGTAPVGLALRMAMEISFPCSEK
jgi:hypothetical protein